MTGDASAPDQDDDQDDRPAAAAQPARARPGWIDCGWGRLIFGPDFPEAEALVAALRAEAPGRRDIAIHVRDPHVVLAVAPQELFLDPSHTYRLDLASYRDATEASANYRIRPMRGSDAEAVNAILRARDMMDLPAEFLRAGRDAEAVPAFVAEDRPGGGIIGIVMGVDHVAAFGDPGRGASLWSLAVAPQAPHDRVGERLSRAIAGAFCARGRAFLELTVLHDNAEAIALYEKLGFRRVETFAVKRKNPFNERLFVGKDAADALNPYARIIVNEARQRGIAAEVLDAEGGYFRLTHGGRSVRCRESLSDFTSAVAMSMCDDKRVTRRIVAAAGVRVPAQVPAGDPAALRAFLADHGAVVVKPARGEQGQGVAVGLRDVAAVEAACARARALCPDVVVEEHFDGEDLRLVVIGHQLVAAAVRRPPHVRGDGVRSIRRLIEGQSRRRMAATGGESRIPLDAETEACLRDQGRALDDVPEAGADILVRRAANLHAGGTIHDVTDRLHPALAEAAVAAARALEIPVTGIDLMVRSPEAPDYVFIEANERPGLANHEPQPTAERFVDLLFPATVRPEA